MRYSVLRNCKDRLIFHFRQCQPRPVISWLLLSAALLTAASLPGYFLQNTAASTPAVVQSAQQTQAGPQSISPDAVQTITLLTENDSQHLSLEEYLIGVVFAEMPPSFEVEALKAQAVAARTYTLNKMQNSRHAGALCSDSSCCQAWISDAACREKYGEQYPEWYEKISDAVRATSGLVLLYHGQLIDATYFSSSGGKTEDAAAVWGSDVPYLISVESPEPDAPHRSDSVSIPFTQFCDMIHTIASDADLSGNPAGWFGAQTATAGGGVNTLEIGGILFSGTDLRSLFSLRSTAFTVEIAPDSIVFTTTGNGHRVGMSQYGANAMAAAGNDFRAILTHYYSGVEIKNAVPT